MKRTASGEPKLAESVMKQIRQPRPLLASPSTLAEALAAIDAARHIVVLAGAGISVSCGVPDFRSEDGVYAIAQKMGLELSDPQDLFDLAFFEEDPQPFYTFAGRLWPRPGKIEPGTARDRRVDPSSLTVATPSSLQLSVNTLGVNDSQAKRIASSRGSSPEGSFAAATPKTSTGSRRGRGSPPPNSSTATALSTPPAVDSAANKRQSPPH